MSVDDRFIANAISAGDIEPAPGTLWGLRFDPSSQSVEVDGLGTVTARMVTDSGIVVAKKLNESMDPYMSTQAIVCAIGVEDDEQWFTWADAGIEDYIVVAFRAVGGIDQSRGSKYVNLRWTEIMAVGNTGDGPSMLPAPGFCLLKISEVDDERESGLIVTSLVKERLDHTHEVECDVIAVGMHDGDPGFAVGDKVLAPYYRTNGATEWMTASEVDDSGVTHPYRFVPIGDVLAVCE